MKEWKADDILEAQRISRQLEDRAEAEGCMVWWLENRKMGLVRVDIYGKNLPSREASCDMRNYNEEIGKCVAICKAMNVELPDFISENLCNFLTSPIDGDLIFNNRRLMLHDKNNSRTHVGLLHFGYMYRLHVGDKWAAAR